MDHGDLHMKPLEILDDEGLSGPSTFGVLDDDSRMGSKFRLAALFFLWRSPTKAADPYCA
jgi:hypothetical protein